MTLTVQTLYGPLGPVDFPEYGPDGALIGCVPAAPLALETPLGRLNAQHSTDDARRPKVHPIEFHPDGSLKSMALEERTVLPTPLGPLPAEFVSFHPDGELRRVFPVYGKLSGYWTEKEEATLNDPLTLETPAGSITARIAGVQFFPGGALKSVTLWPGESVEIETPLGRQKARIGISFHESGALRSFEPAALTPVPTPIGILEAFDPDALGIHGDVCSLEFGPDGEPVALSTPMNTVEAALPDGKPRRFAPTRVPNLCDERVQDVKPLRVRFQGGAALLGEDPAPAFPLDTARFTVGRLLEGLFAPIRYDCGL
ncbi:hypothetical protein NNJEOMEG_01117 [Fundidesulfovibrio magnetotacticus]|uniref:Uncharacterized protein n=1 Tax=Fundidesulfovibrio magnetotacticus TaxID=2730080 RepID=A0A6V8LU04_9BACT|nr:hypothetical protein [Fundidesulfovibrio magnetotacticus]GFK93286.1 hypothetical protein NNJEOMEG_01117 [Fundidesulfovibrio magnetotacticus]